MSRLNLPSIPGSISDEKNSNLFDVQPIAEEDEVGETQFDTSFQKLLSLQFPPMNPMSSVKHRIGSLEESTQTQHEFNRLTGKSFHNLSNNVHSLEDMMREIVKQSQADMEGKMLLMRKEYDHRFELQTNENKRLQSHIASLKADNTMLKRKLQGTIEKLRKLQQEFGDPDDPFEEESSIISATGTFNGGNSTRPHTIA